jgi:signal transduction histidine kinase
MRPVRDSPLVRSLVAGITAFRVACLAWLVAVVLATWDVVARPAAAWILVGAAGLVTLVWSLRFRRDGAEGVLRPAPLAVDVGVAAALALGDGVVYDGPHPLSLGSAWPLASVLSAGLALGARGGCLAGVVVGVGRAIGDLLEDGSGWSPDETLARASTLFLYALAGTMAGYAARRLIDSEAQIALTRAREEVARTLHDGVLQTLAVVQRRSGDDELARLAREQERELREYLYGAGIADGGGDLGAALRRVCGRAESRDGTTVRVVVAPDAPALRPAAVEAVAGAVGEACTNASKHGRAGSITVYAEPDETGGLVCSVKDDGRGFDPGAVAEGIGLTQSVRARIAEVGGTVEIDGNPGRGTEVRLRLPVTGRSLGT